MYSRSSSLASMALALALGNASMAEANRAYGITPDYAPEWQRAKRSRWGSKQGYAANKRQRARTRNKIARRSRAANR